MSSRTAGAVRTTLGLDAVLSSLSTLSRASRAGLATLALLVAAAACRGPSTAPAGSDRAAGEVLVALRSFEAAQRTLDPDAVIAFLAPEFSMLQDGVRFDRESTVEQIRAALPTLRAFEPRFEDVQVIVLAPDAALTSMTFRDRTTAADGAITNTSGPSTLLWRLHAGRWRIVFADSDHDSE